MIEKINILIFIITLLTQCFSNYAQNNVEDLENKYNFINIKETNNVASNINNENINRLRIYDYGIPSNIQELYEIQNGKLLPMAKVKYINYKIMELKFDRGKKIISQKPFAFNIKSGNCPETEIYKRALAKAEEVISNALDIKRTINVDVYVEDFCNTLSGAACMSLVGMTYSPIYVALKESADPNEREYAYPQALAKQLILDKEIDYTDHDLIIYLNTHMAKDDYSELIITHEIIHGLGFMGNGVLIGQSIGMHDMKEELFSPYVYYNLENNDKSFNYHLLGFLPFTIFEKFIVPIKNDSSYLFRSGFDEFFNKSINITTYSLNALSSSSDQFDALTDIYKNIYENNKAIDNYREIAKLYLTHNSIGFRTNDGEVVKLQTFNDKYLSSSSVCHIAVPFQCEVFNRCFSSEINDYDNEYLMYFSYPLQFKTSEMIKKFNNKYGLIGPKLLKILTTMGWTEKGTTPNTKIYYVVNDQFPDIYDNLFEINANKKMYENVKNDTYLVSFSNRRYTHLKCSYYILSILILSIYIFKFIYVI